MLRCPKKQTPSCAFLRLAWLASTGLVSASLGINPAEASCTAANSIILCAGDTPTTGYGNGTQSNLTLQVVPNASVSGGTPNANAGMELGSGNTLTNLGAITGNVSGVVSNGKLNVTNNGRISGTAGAGVQTTGDLTLANTQLVQGTTSGVSALLGSATITNSGSLYSQGVGIHTDFNLTLNNSGSVTGSNIALDALGIDRGFVAKVTNSGLIQATNTDGVAIKSGIATVTNTGQISGSITAVSSATVTNAGQINGRNGVAITSGMGATVTNSGLVVGGLGAISGGVLTVTNTGTLGSFLGSATTILGDQVTLNNGGVVQAGANAIAIQATNGASLRNTNLIQAGNDGIAITSLGTLTLNNSGSIQTGNSTDGVSQTAAIVTSGNATITNTGNISAGSTGPTYGLVSGGSLNLRNGGSIIADTGVSALAGGTITNTGLIQGHTVGVVSGGAVTLTNNGSIFGTGGTAIQLTGAADTLNLGANSIIGGAIKTGGGGDTINVDGSGHKTTILNFDTLAGAKVSVTGTDNYAVSGHQIVMADDTSLQAVQRGILNVRDSVSDLTHERMMVSEHRTRTDPLAGLWIEGFGSSSKQTASGSNLGGSDRHAGLIGGYEDNTIQSLHVGVFGGAATGRGTTNGDTAQGQYGLAGAYARWTPGALLFEGDYVGGLVSDTTTRQLATNMAGSGFDTAKGTLRGHFLSPSASVGVRVVLDSVTTLTPSVRVRYLTSTMGADTEVGAVSGNTITSAAHTSSNLETRVQLQAEHKISFANGTLSFFETVGGLQQHATGAAIATQIDGIDLAPVPQNTQQIWGAFGVAGFEWRNAAGTSLYVNAKGEWHSDKTITASGRAGAIWRF